MKILISSLMCTGLLAFSSLAQEKPQENNAEPGKTEKAMGSAGKVVDKAAGKTVEGTKAAADATGKTARKVGGATVRGVKRTAKATETGARKATAATGEGLSKAGETLKKADPNGKGKGEEATVKK
jgi:hypothetical protein